MARIYGGVNLELFRNSDLARVRRLCDQFLGDRLRMLWCWALPRGSISALVCIVEQEHYKEYDLLFQALARVSFPYDRLVLGPGPTITTT